LAVLLPLLNASGASQTANDSERQAREVLESAISALGGQKYLDIKSLIGRGLYSQFNDKGELQALLPFVDYIAYPDRERTEFGKGKRRFIQTNVGATGWIFDGEAKNIRDQKEEEIENFQRGLRRNIDLILRARWRTEGAKLRYLGEKELWFRQRGVGVEIAFPMPEDSREVVELYFDPQTRLPVKLTYDNEEDRFYLYQIYGGIQVPLRVDHFKGDVQTARISYDAVELNASIDPKLFDKPVNPDKIK
jgi:hypothetical protein